MKIEMEVRRLFARVDALLTLMRGGRIGSSIESLEERMDLELKTVRMALWQEEEGWEPMVQSGVLQLMDGDIKPGDLTKEPYKLSTSLGRVLLACKILPQDFGRPLMQRLRAVGLGSLSSMLIAAGSKLVSKIPHMRTELCDMQTPELTCKAFLQLMGLLGSVEGDAVLLDNAKRVFEFVEAYGQMELERKMFDEETNTETTMLRRIGLAELSDLVQRGKDMAAEDVDLSSADSDDFPDFTEISGETDDTRVAPPPAGKVHGGEDGDDGGGERPDFEEIPQRAVAARPVAARPAKAPTH